MGDLKDLEPTAKRLNAATDELNKALQTIQDKLNAMGVGVEAWIDEPLTATDWRDIFDRDDEPTGHREFDADELGYGRLGDGWALLVRTRRYVEGPDPGTGFLKTEAYEDSPGERKPLLRAARNLRVEAVALIPNLIDVLKAQADHALKRIEQAKKIAESLE